MIQTISPNLNEIILLTHAARKAGVSLMLWISIKGWSVFNCSKHLVCRPSASLVRGCPHTKHGSCHICSDCWKQPVNVIPPQFEGRRIARTRNSCQHVWVFTIRSASQQICRICRFCFVVVWNHMFSKQQTFPHCLGTGPSLRKNHSCFTTPNFCPVFFFFFLLFLFMQLLQS